MSEVPLYAKGTNFTHVRTEGWIGDRPAGSRSVPSCRGTSPIRNRPPLWDQRMPLGIVLL